MRSIKKLKAVCGVNLFALSEDAMADPDTMSAVLWAGLIHEHDALTVDEVDGMYDLSDLKYISDKIAEAMGGDTEESDPTATSSE